VFALIVAVQAGTAPVAGATATATNPIPATRILTAETRAARAPMRRIELRLSRSVG
jgi:hypothetical protein